MSDKSNHKSPYDSEPFVFPAWATAVMRASAPAAILGGCAVIFAVWYWFSPKFTDAGYQPTQPVPYSHKLHAGDLGIDCRYCHIGVETTAHAQVPPTQVCMNCHSQVKGASYNEETKVNPKLAPIMASWEEDLPVPWVRIHKIPDYAFFDHSRHVNKGVGCVSCHGRIDQMVVVHQEKPLSMGWCLECHRAPEEFLRPLDKITKMDYAGGDGFDPVAFKASHNIQPPEDCSGCHR